MSQNIKRINQVFQVCQALQLALLSMQGVLLITSTSKEFYAPIWIGLGLLALVQFMIVFQSPKQVEMTQLIDRPVMLRIRLIAILPYALILWGLFGT